MTLSNDASSILRKDLSLVMPAQFTAIDGLCENVSLMFTIRFITSAADETSTLNAQCSPGMSVIHTLVNLSCMK